METIEGAEIKTNKDGLIAMLNQLSGKDNTEFEVGSCKGLFFTDDKYFNILAIGNKEPHNEDFAFNADKWGKKREIKTVYMDKTFFTEKKEIRRVVKEHFVKHNFEFSGWKLWSDGTNSRQDDKQYHYEICRFIEREDNNEYTDL